MTGARRWVFRGIVAAAAVAGWLWARHVPATHPDPDKPLLRIYDIRDVVAGAYVTAPDANNPYRDGFAVQRLRIGGSWWYRDGRLFMYGLPGQHEDLRRGLDHARLINALNAAEPLLPVQPERSP